MAYSDDGVKVYIDNNLVLSDWSLHAPRTAKAKNLHRARRAQPDDNILRALRDSQAQDNPIPKRNTRIQLPGFRKTLYIEDPNGILKGHKVIVIEKDGSILTNMVVNDKGQVLIPLIEEQNSKVLLVVVS